MLTAEEDSSGRDVIDICQANNLMGLLEEECCEEDEDPLYYEVASAAVLFEARLPVIFESAVPTYRALRVTEILGLPVDKVKLFPAVLSSCDIL